MKRITDFNNYREACKFLQKKYDNLGFERFGKIVAIEPYAHPIYWIYIEDSDPDFNFYEDVVNGKVVSYGEIRPSDEVYIDE